MIVPRSRPRPLRAVALGVAGLLLIGGAAAFFMLRPGASYDRSFDTRIAAPAFRGYKPVVLFDEGHKEIHTTGGAYHPLAEMLRHDGYTVKTNEKTIDATSLTGAAVLVVAGARGTNDANDGPAFTDAEADAIGTWVRNGGSFLLVADHWPFGAAVAPLAARFGVTMGSGMVEDPAHCDPKRGASHIVFSLENRLLHDHPIVRGRGEAERVHRVLTFTGTSVSVPFGATAFLALADSATERLAGTPHVERKGGDVRVSMEYGQPISAAGKAQGIVLEFGTGRVVVLGEAGMLRAQHDEKAGNVGMNAEGYDNRQLALCIFHWLTNKL